ncbi:protein VCF1 [Trichomycterus rosablanca]|uniref:protein VCF1 n=1 Tax=Trichomycterus rosablanca TaxID=2290929 RepID=UPI002F3548F9
MLTENRKRQRTQGEDEDAQLRPQAKRLSAAPSEGSREAWESESLSSDSSGVSSPEHAAGSSSSSASSQYGAEILRSCSPSSTLDQPGPASLGSYQNINRVLREAHFQSLQNKGQSRDR